MFHVHAHDDGKGEGEKRMESEWEEALCDLIGGADDCREDWWEDKIPSVANRPTCYIKRRFASAWRFVLSDKSLMIFHYRLPTSNSKNPESIRVENCVVILMDSLRVCASNEKAAAARRSKKPNGEEYAIK